MNTAIVITSAVRTPMGGFQGDFTTLTAAQLGSAAIRSAVAHSQLEAATIDEVIMGNVLSAGQGQAPARQASLGAGLSPHTPCTTLNKMCGSGMQALIFAHDLLRAGSARIIVAGGMESMSNAPYLLPKARTGLRLGHGEIKDHMFLDGLEDAYEKGRLMGHFAEDCAEKYAFSRAAQDEFALRSLSRAKAAIESGAFTAEIVPVNVKQRHQTIEICHDEQPSKANLDKIPTLKPAFKANGTITPANASSISDGASALVLMSENEASQRGIKPLARIVGHARFAHAPAWFSTAPVFAMQKLLKQLNWHTNDVDLYEINEAFAVVVMAAMHELKLSPERVNIHGGACALGHPIGASGARIVTTLIHALRHQGGRKGIASVCIGGGEATALALELM